eukprot:g3229.t1
MGLSSLDNFPTLPGLQKLSLADSKISGGLDVLADRVKSLRSLDIAGNRIASIADLKPLSVLPSLKRLDVYGCPCAAEEETYRQQIFEALPTVDVVDGEDRSGNAISDEDDDDEEEDEDEDEDGDGYEAEGIDDSGLQEHPAGGGEDLAGGDDDDDDDEEEVGDDDGDSEDEEEDGDDDDDDDNDGEGEDEATTEDEGPGSGGLKRKRLEESSSSSSSSSNKK